MAENKAPEQDFALAPANGDPRSDQDSAISPNSKELRRKKRKKCFLYILLFAVFQTGIVTLFALTVMKFKNPKFRLRSASFQAFETRSNSFNIRMNIEVGVKNTNFGHFKYESTNIEFYYRGIKIGQEIVRRGRARARSTRKSNIPIHLRSSNLTSSNSQQLANDIASEILPFTAQARLRGKVRIMLILKKNKIAHMNCTMQANIRTRQLQNLTCI